MYLDRDLLPRIMRGTVGPPPPAVPHQAACVSLLFFEQRGHTFFPAILKADRQGYPWRNQVALPGGLIDDSDASPQAAALREVEEELGIQPAHVDYAGSLGHFQTLQNKVIEVFVGNWSPPADYELIPDPYEIARVLLVPLETIVRTHQQQCYHGHLPGVDKLVYPFEDVVIWGVTAKILHHFVERLYLFL